MSKATGIDLGSLADTKGPAVTWTLLAVIYALGNLYQFTARPFAFPYTMTYLLAFFMVAVIIAKAWSKEKIGSLFGVMAFFVAMLTWISSGGYIEPTACMYLAIVFAVIGLLNEYGVLETSYNINFKYTLIGSLGAIFLFGLLYFLSRLGFVPIGALPNLFYWTGPLPWFTILNHIGIMAMALLDLLLIFGAGDWDDWRIYRVAALGLAIIGALMLLATPGWGLGILP
jgi:hypothetical protein